MTDFRENSVIICHLADLKVEYLQNELGKRGLETTGNKKDLIERLTKLLLEDGYDPDNFTFEIPSSEVSIKSQKNERASEGADLDVSSNVESSINSKMSFEEDDSDPLPCTSKNSEFNNDDIPVVVRSQKELTLSTIHSYLRKRKNSTLLMPYRPQGGTVYLYYNPEREEDWRADGYRWYGSGRRLLPPSAPLLLKKYFQILVQGKNTPVNSKEFRRYVYHLASDAEGTQGTLIHYIGTAPEEGILYQPKREKKRKQLMRTTLSVLEEARKLNQDPSVLMKIKNACAKTMSQEKVVKPRSHGKESQGLKGGARKFSQEEVCNLVEMTHDLQDYIHWFFLVPEVGVVLAHRAMLQEFRAVLSTPSQQPQLLSYNITEKMGNYYVSPLLFKHTLFNEAPVMPVAFLIHECKSQYAHAMFMQFIAKEVPEINGALFVTNGEDNVVKAIANKLPQVWHLSCWNHLQRGVKKWLKEHGSSEADCRIHIQHFKQLLMSASESDYKNRLDVFSQKWSQSFKEYYEKNIDNRVTTYAGRWILEPLGVYNGYTGVTTNQCEGFDTLLKTFIDRKENAIESFALGLYYLQSYFKNEIQRSLAGAGNYNLLNTFESLRIRAEGMELQQIYAPCEILGNMMEHKNQENAPSVATNEGVLNEADDEPKVERESQADSTSSTESKLVGLSPLSRSTSRKPAKNKINLKKAHHPIALCQMARARAVLDNQKLVYNEQTKIFVVKGTSGPHEIKLFPKATCTCPVRKQCYHILAVKLYMGIDFKPTKRMSLTQLKRNLSAKQNVNNVDEGSKRRNKRKRKNMSLHNEEVVLTNDNNDTTNQVYDNFLQDISLLQTFPSSTPTALPQNPSLPKLVSINGMNHLANITIIRKFNNPSSSSSFSDLPTFTSNS